MPELKVFRGDDDNSPSPRPRGAPHRFEKEELRSLEVFKNTRDLVTKDLRDFFQVDNDGILKPGQLWDSKRLKSLSEYFIKRFSYLRAVGIEASDLEPVFLTGGTHTLKRKILKMSSSTNEDFIKKALACCEGIEAAIHRTYPDFPSDQKTMIRNIHQRSNKEQTV